MAAVVSSWNHITNLVANFFCFLSSLSGVSLPVYQSERAMAQLLGSKTCLESLGNNVLDLENVFTSAEVHKSGKLARVKSWKFPDKSICDIDVREILQHYSYSIDDDESNQMAHIVLLEMLIDRLGPRNAIHDD